MASDLQGALIRKYRSDDRESVRNISWDTAFLGSPADIFFFGKNILADFLTLYFTDYEPQSCFVAENKGRVVGYLIGAKNIGAISASFKFKTAARLLIKAITGNEFFKKKNLIFSFNCLLSFFRGEFSMPDFSKGYPATLHINIGKGFRGQNIGSRLMSAYLDYLVKEKVPGVSLATMSDKAAEFFKKQGFNLLHAGRRSYLRYLLHKDLPVYIFGKKLL